MRFAGKTSGLLFLIILLNASFCLAQFANIRGFVYQQENGEPSIFITVYLEGTTHGAVTDVNGYYSITKIPPGSYTLRITSLGNDSIKETMTVKAGDIITKKIYLKKSPIQLKTIEISAEQEAKKSDVRISVNTITPKEIKQIPTVGGEPDLAQYLQVLPGIVFTGDQGGQLYIRGGTPVQNKVLLDGMIIYNPFHSIGLFSVFDADIIRNADVYTGGFGAQYGGRISSIMDITTRDGNKKQLSGKVSASTFGAKTLVEGPLGKNKDNAGGSSSFILSAKTSYLPTTSKYVYSYVDPNGLPFSFNDFYGKTSFNANNGSKLNLFGFNFSDHVKYQALSDLNWKSYGGGSNFILIPPNSPVLVKGHFAYSSYGIEMKEELFPSRKSDVRGFNMGFDFTYFLGKNQLEYGIEALGFKTNFEFYNSVNRLIQQEESTTELGAYFRYKIISKNKKLIIEPGFRTQYYASLSNFSPEPRLGIKYNLTDKFRLKFASGLYSQNLIAANSDRDVVNLFYGFLSGPDNLQETLTKQDGSVKPINHSLQKAYHVIGGMEYDLFKHFDINLEGYYKNFTQLTNINRNKIYEDNADNATKPDYQKKDFIVETGSAMGVDVVVKYDYKHFYFWTVYSLGFVKRWDGIQEYSPQFDRRHNINLVGSYAFGKHHSWEVDARWNFGSGFPFTPTAGFYPKQTFSGGINSNYISSNEELGILYGDYNSHRLPAYHRLDLNVKKKFDFSENSTLEVAVGVTNAYDRANIFYFDRIQYKRVNQLPILPSVSANWTF